MPSRHSTSASPYTTPSSASRTTRTLSPPISQSTSYSPTVTPYSNSTKLNVVTRVAIEGKAKQGKDGANIKMYLKVSAISCLLKCHWMPTRGVVRFLFHWTALPQDPLFIYFQVRSDHLDLNLDLCVWLALGIS